MKTNFFQQYGATKLEDVQFPTKTTVLNWMKKTYNYSYGFAGSGRINLIEITK